MMEKWNNGMLEYWNNEKMEAVGAKHSSQGVKVIPSANERAGPAAVNKNASPLLE